MTTVEELKKRLLKIFEDRGHRLNLSTLNEEYSKNWHESLFVSWVKLTNVKKKKKLSMLAKEIMGNDVEVVGKEAHLKIPVNATTAEIIPASDSPALSSESNSVSSTSNDFKRIEKVTNEVTIVEEKMENKVEINKKLPKLTDVSVVDSFMQYHSFQQLHIVYCKVRIVALMHSLKKRVLYVEQFRIWFNEMYREDFFTNSVLKYYVSKTNSYFQNSELFLEQFCYEFLKVSEEAGTRSIKMTLTKDISMLYTTLRNEMICLLEKLDLPSDNLIVPEMMLLGKASKDVDIYHTMLCFNVPNSRVLSSKERPTLNEINQKVFQIQNKICRRGDVVRVPEIVKELCTSYNVSCVKDLCPLESKPLRQETDIPAINNIVRLQGKINAFIQSFITFRNICTLYELNQEICKMESKTSFADLKLGPLQKQLLVYDKFKFPPNKEDIPHIETLDVFDIIWRLLCMRKRKLRVEGQQENSSKGPNSQTLITLTELMDFLIKQYGYADPYETGVLISSIGLAVSVVKTAAFGDLQHEGKVFKNFNDQLHKELDFYIAKKLKEFVGSKKPSHDGEPQNLVERLCGMNLLDAFNEIFLMLNHMKKEASKFSSGSALINSSEKLMKTITAIQKDPFLRRIFHIVISTAPLKAIGIDDIDILSCLGFDKIIKQLIKPKDTVKDFQNPPNGSVAIPKSEILQTTKKWLSQNADITIESLFRIEKQILSTVNENYKHFEDLGHGSFLKFLVDNSIDKHLVNFKLNPASNSGFSNNLTKEDVSNFIQQCGVEKSKDDKDHAIKIQFQVKDTSSFLVMINNNPVDAKGSVFLYQHAVLCGTEYQKELISTANSEENLSKLAVSKINALPYLEEISRLTNWDEMFQNKLGSLKTFIKSNFVLKDICFLFLEFQSGKFMKVMKNCSVELFTESLAAKDAKMTSLRLTSLLCLNGQIDHAPLTLLSNRMELFMQTTFQAQDNPDNFLINFTLECFQLIPFHILCCVSRKVFLSPLSTIYGSLNVPCLLLNACANNSNHKSRLHALGFQISIAEWIESYKVELDKGLKDNIHSKDILDNNDELNEKRVKVTDIPVNLQGASSTLLLVDPLSSATILTTDEVVHISAAPTDVLHEQFIYDIQNDSCHKFINEIRREQFGIGLELGEQEMKLIEIHREREGRSLERLSNELYSKDSHFVLELIQNADDNYYPERLMESNSVEKPTVAFIVEHDKIIILNNENGFSEKDIRALCDVGKSTKGIHRKGYIGQKGIGFKSVFRVTDAPEIHSNGFHIKFDVSSGSNGYILPHWIYDWKSDRRLSYQPCKHINFTWKTQIVLPLKKEMQHAKLVSRFHDVHSSLLLFLNRLFTIIIDDKVSNVIKVMERKNLDKNLVCLSNNNDASLWFVVEKEIPIDVREDAKSTTIAVAFPFSNKSNAEGLPFQQVFAFLPLRSYGFKFVIQADFEVPSSREDINKDSAWNQYILQHLPKLVVEAFHSFKVHQHFKGLEGIVEYFKFMDLEDHVIGVFKQVSQQIIKCLQWEACLPVMPKENKEDHVCWEIPSQIVYSQEQTLKVVYPDMLEQKLGLFYLHTNIGSTVSKRVLAALGVSELKLEQLLEICNLVVQQFNLPSQTKKESDEMHQWVGKWLHLIYIHLQHAYDCTQKTLDSICSLHIFPMANGSMMSLKDNVAFFPVNVNYMVQSVKTKEKGRKAINLIEKDLQVLSHNLMSCLDDIEQQQLKKLLYDLGVKDITPLGLIQNHIIPTFKSGNWKSKSEELVVAYAIYLHEQHMLNPEIFDITEAAQWIVLLTNKGFQSPADSSNPIYLTPQYGSKIDLKSYFPSVNWTLLSDCYISDCSQKQKDSFFQFFLDLSLKMFFVIRKSRKSLHVSDMVGSCWHIYFQTWPKTIDDTYIIHDLECPELNQIIDAQVFVEIEALLPILDQHWDKEFSKYDLSKPSCHVENASGQFVVTTYSSLLLKMRSAAWLIDSNKIPKLHLSRDLYVNKNDIFSLMGDKVNYLTNQIKSKDLILTLGIQTDVRFESFVREFKKWCEESPFTTSYLHTINIYKYFEEHQSVLNQKLSELKKGPFVFLVNDCNIRMFTNDSIVEGRFFSFNCLCWEDPSGMLSYSKNEIGHSRILKGYYPDEMQNFFVFKLGVNRYPSIQEYVSLASSIASETTLPDKVACEKLFTLFSVLAPMFIIDNKLEELNDWSFSESAEYREQQYEDLISFIEPRLTDNVKDFMNERIFPTSNNRFCSISDLPLLVDSNSLTKIFQESGQVSLIFFDFILNMIKPDDSSSHRSKRTIEAFYLKMLKIMLFFKACNIKLLSNVYIEPEITTTLMKSGCSKWEKVLHDISPIVQRFLNKKINDVYKQLCSKSFHECLQNTAIFTVEKLETVYRLSDRNSVNISHLKVAFVLDADTKHPIIYITSEYAEEKAKFDEILGEIFSLFVGNNEEHKEKLLEFILVYLETLNKTLYLKLTNIPEISPNEEKWHYPEPKMIHNSKVVPVAAVPPQNVSLALEGAGLTCWPPRNPAGLGFIAKPESLKKAEKEIFEKWNPPEYPEGDENKKNIEKEKLEKRILLEPSATDQASLEQIANKPIEAYSISSDKLNNGKSDRGIDFKKLKKPEIEDQYEDLSSFLSGNLIDQEIFNFEVKEFEDSEASVGRYGEKIVYHCLCNYYKEDINDGKAKIIWLNEKEETGDPFDLMIEFPGTEQSSTYIEVKTSYVEGKKEFEISPNQLRFAFEHKADFHLYRVTVNNEKPKIKRLKNLSMFMDSKSVRLFMIL